MCYASDSIGCCWADSTVCYYCAPLPSWMIDSQSHHVSLHYSGQKIMLLWSNKNLSSSFSDVLHNYYVATDNHNFTFFEDPAGDWSRFIHYTNSLVEDEVFVQRWKQHNTFVWKRPKVYSCFLHTHKYPWLWFHPLPFLWWLGHLTTHVPEVLVSRLSCIFLLM